MGELLGGSENYLGMEAFGWGELEGGEWEDSLVVDSSVEVLS